MICRLSTGPKAYLEWYDCFGQEILSTIHYFRWADILSDLHQQFSTEQLEKIEINVILFYLLRSLPANISKPGPIALQYDRPMFFDLILLNRALLAHYLSPWTILPQRLVAIDSFKIPD